MNECMNGCMNEWMGEVPRHTPYFSMQQQQHPHPVPPPDAPLPEDTPPSFPEEEEDEVYSGEEEKYNSPAEEEEEEEGEEEHDDEGDDVWDEAEDEAESGPIHEEQMTSSETQESPERAAGTPVVVDLCKDIWKDGTAFQQATAEIAEGTDVQSVVKEIDSLVNLLAQLKRQIEVKAQLPKEDKWVKMVASNGRIFYYNAAQRITQWEKPESLMSEEEKAAALPPPPGEAAGILFKVSLPAAMGHITLSGKRPENSSVARMKLTLAQKLFRQARAKVKNSKARSSASAPEAASSDSSQNLMADPSPSILRGIVKKWSLRFSGSEEILDDDASAHQVVIMARERGFQGNLLALDLIVPGAKRRRKPPVAQVPPPRTDTETGTMAMLTSFFQ